MIALDTLQLALLPTIKTTELVEIGFLGDGRTVCIEKDFDGETVAWIGDEWFELTAAEYAEIRGLVVR